MARPLLRAAVSGALAGLLVLPAAPALAAASVDARANYFAPKIATIRNGHKVTWHFDGATFHDVSDTSGMDGYDSGDLHNGETFSHDFDWAGTYAYECDLHEGMTGKVRVRMGASLTGRRIALTWGAATPYGFFTDVQVRVPLGKWRNWRRDVAGVGAGIYKPRDGHGRYSFRARFREVAPVVASTSWSPFERVRV